MKARRRLARVLRTSARTSALVVVHPRCVVCNFDLSNGGPGHKLRAVQGAIAYRTHSGVLGLSPCVGMSALQKSLTAKYTSASSMTGSSTTLRLWYCKLAHVLARIVMHRMRVRRLLPVPHLP